MFNVLLTASVRAGAGITILAPPEHSATRANHVYVVGRTGAPVVEISLNNDIVREVVPRDSVFHAIVSFGYGMHAITATAIWPDTLHEVSVDTLEIASTPSFDHRHENLYVPYAFHAANPKSECLGCHTIKTDLSVASNDSSHCLECHGVMRENFRTHIPNDDRACAVCHKIASDLTLAVSKASDIQNPCYGCHKDKIGLFAQDYIHGPVAGGGCVVCHSPHGSIHEKSLRSPVGVLCSSCHELHEAQSMQHQHQPFERDKCTACHDPHSTNYRWVLVRDSQELCLGCHKQLDTTGSHQHPYNVKPHNQLARPLKLTAEGELECLSCHHPHASDTEHMLRTSQGNICVGCHPNR